MYTEDPYSSHTHTQVYTGNSPILAILPLLTCIPPRSHKFNVRSNALGTFVVLNESGAFIVYNLLIML
jgi:hypothetical protein